MQCLTVESSRDCFAPNLECLKLHLLFRLGGRVRQLHLHWRESGLILRGVALSSYAKQLAQQAVMAATKSPIRANEIEVL